MTVVIIACSESKQSSATNAANLYTSPRFRSSWDWACAVGEVTWILSAKHGLLKPDQIIEPYDTALESLTSSERRHLVEAVRARFTPSVRESVIVLGDTNYAALVRDAWSSAEVLEPLAGMDAEGQLRWLNASLAAPTDALALEQMYSALSRLAGGSLSADSLPTLEEALRSPIPPRGVYFFFEEHETRHGTDQLRVTRVGTHAVSRGAASTLRSRLRTHAGTEALSGSHRSSIFRLHVGAALLQQASGTSRTWGTASGKSVAIDVRNSEAPVERAVSIRLRAMRVLSLEVADTPSSHSDRSFIERNAIGLLSTIGRAVDPPSDSWLGIWSARKEIRESGLWNLEHLGHPMHPQFIDVLDKCVDGAGSASHGDRSLAPAGWWTSASPLF